MNPQATHGKLSLDLERSAGRWALYVGLGAVVMLLGVFALVYSAFAAIATVLVLGWVMAGSGIIMMLHSVATRDWAGNLVQLLGGTLMAVFGFLLAFRPGIGAAVLGLLLGALFMVEGIYQVVVGASVSLRGRGWLVFSGAVSIILALIVFAGLPGSAVWLIGVLVGVDLLSNGALMAGFGFEARKLHKAQHEAAGAPSRHPA